jgi:hypothetical protein
MRYHQVIMFAFAFFAVVASLGAQSTISGYVTGVVSDPSNAVVNNASVTLKNSDTSFTQSAKSGSDGVFRFEYVPPGNYNLSVTATGFRTAEQTIAVTVGQSTTANIQLAVGSSASTVVIAGESNPIQTENGDITTNYNETQIQLAPNPGADITYVAQTAPGAVMNTQSGGGNFSVFGLPGYSE